MSTTRKQGRVSTGTVTSERRSVRFDLRDTAFGGAAARRVVGDGEEVERRVRRLVIVTDGKYGSVLYATFFLLILIEKNIAYETFTHIPI